MAESKMEFGNIREEIEQTNPVELLTPNDVFDTIQMYDSTM